MNKRMDAPVVTVRRIDWQRWLLAGVLAIFVVVSVQYTLKALQHRSAFVRWREQILQLETGRIYERYNYPNPPIMALMLRPLAELPPVVGALIWFYAKALMAVWSMWMMFRMLERDGPAFPTWAKFTAVFLSLRPLIGDLHHGNVNILILFLVIASLYSYCNNRDVLCGVLLALAISCKVTPLLFVPYFLWKRQWRVLSGVAIGLGLFLILIPGLILGFRENIDQLLGWSRVMLLPFVKDGFITTEHHNQSLPGVVYRLLTHSPSFVTYPNGTWTPAEYHNLTDIGNSWAKWIVRSAQVAFVVLIAAVCRTAKNIRGGWQLCAEFSLVAVGMLIFSERTWKHHCVTLLLPFCAIVYYLSTQVESMRGRITIGIVIATVIGLMLTASGLLSERAADIAMVYGPYLWAFLLLIGALAIILAKTRQCDSSRREALHHPNQTVAPVTNAVV
jgi:hypothetical protein